MNIKFNYIKWRNFLSTGNQYTTIQLDRSTTTLIVGDNGAGKSTVLDALCFVLFGKAFRNINKPQLVNTVNMKDCLVEIGFTVGTKGYIVTRGIKPTIFTIHCDGVLINQDAAAKDYQKVLEEQILKLNYKSFTQIVVLGSASFTPFMQLPLAHRRDIIEDILDIQVFSTMNVLLKDKVSITKDAIKDIDSALELAKQHVKIQQDFIKKVEQDRDSKAKEILAEIDKTTAEINEAQGNVDALLEQVEEKSKLVQDIDTLKKKASKLSGMQEKLKACQTKLDVEIGFYHDNNECPTCKQGISHSYKTDIITQKTEKNTEVDAALGKLQGDLQVLQERLRVISSINGDIQVLNIQMRDHNNVIVGNQKYLSKLRKQADTPTQNSVDLEKERQNLKDIAKKCIGMAEEKSALKLEQEYQGACAMLLKDTGIKTKIVKQYLPIINKMVNKYLTSMDFFVHFELDDAFNESIKSRHRDEFSYASFSEGEKSRIDLALLFTWRTIAKMKNSANTNLLILDEIFDSSLDNNGTDFVMTLLNALGEDTNLFVISHRGDQLFDKFRAILRFEKVQNFSVVK